ncbi:helix-turn-helix domain-containing protein [Bradyrhizobium japonicum]|uniref:helix-turn-helix transcriptional regulator n=1 Tax=Bradyrhizobium japonicum TaxID=375 RepID=UPI00200CF560|nr:helix-turn-helix transcriptional regulator [Bradyrhizobium japonicum]UQD69232.1 helix-turn-helix domain-containing protein [Bradyrhizobium japonicum]WAX24495.1 helix-turn-helix domain-containing protein [Bradyrhizobium phage ppBjS10J-1]
MAENNHPLAKWREANNRTQEALASDLGVASLTVWRWENRKRTPRIRDAKRISDKTGISVGDLMEAAQ